MVTLWDLIQNQTRAPLNNSSSNQPIVLMDSNAIFIATSYLQFKKITASNRKETLNTLKKISKFAQQILDLFSSGLETFKDLKSEREVFREHYMGNLRPCCSYNNITCKYFLETKELEELLASLA